jgi:membrane protease YdiL (CAAX protease family)
MTDPTNNSLPPNNYEPQHWGFWGTIGFGFLVFTVFGILQSIILIGYGMYREGIDFSSGKLEESELKTIIEKFAYDGDLISLAEIPSAIIGVGLILLFASMKKPFPIAEYLQLRMPEAPVKTFFKWIGIMILVFIVMEGVNIFLERENPEFMTKVYSSTDNKLMLWIAVGVAAPFFEEFLFRGFLLEGLRHTRMGVVGAILLTSASWAIIHMQYGWFEIISIFFIGIVFAVAQLKTKSLYVPIAMHMFMNLTASVMMEFAPAAT